MVRVAVLVALWPAFFPFLMDLSGEARIYNLVIILGPLTFLALLWALMKYRPLWWGLRSFLTSISIATHYYLAFLLLAENLFVILYCKRKERWARITASSPISSMRRGKSGLKRITSP